MSRETGGIEQLEFLQALVKRGFVPIPRMFYDYSGYLELNYDTIGKIFALLAHVGGPGESGFGAYTISRKDNPHDYKTLRDFIVELEELDLVKCEEESDRISFSFMPLYSRLQALWSQDRERWEEAAAAGAKDGSILAAERLLGRPLSDREIADIQDWGATYGYGPDMVEAVINEGQRLGVTRMSYLNQIARQWAEEGIRTPEQAEAYVAKYKQAMGKHKRIVKYLGLGRPFTGAELGLLDKWTEEWGFSDEVIMRAAEIAAGVRNPLQYINRVLESWKEMGVKTVVDADRVEAERRRRPASESHGAAAAKSRRPPGKSNVLLHREKKDENFYDHLYKKFGE